MKTYIGVKMITAEPCTRGEFNFKQGLYPQTKDLTFGLAINAMKQGAKIARQGWNGKNMFLYYVKPNSYPVERNSDSPVKGLFKDDLVPYRGYFALKTAQDDIAMWSPSGSDALAEDWFILND